MDAKGIVTLLEPVELIACFSAALAIVLRKQWSDFWALGSFLAVRGGFEVVSLAIETMGMRHHLERHLVYQTTFYVYWISAAIESMLMLIIIHNIFRLAMAPLKGLQTLGMLVFQWATAISVAVALGTTFGPAVHGHQYLNALLSQLQRTQSILTLSLLVFVCFAIRPMGLSFRSRIFGVSLGLGLMSTNDLAQSAWLSAHSSSMYSMTSVISGVVCCASLILWTAYFILPEPKRQLIILPTTSPFLRWNQISQALGDSPGYVVIGGSPSEVIAPAELEIFRRASVKVVEQFPASARA